LVLFFNLLGCEAFVRKFTRKPKNEPQEEMVLVPEEYKGPQLSKDDLYRRYLFFWQCWQDELITSLTERRSQKKLVDCAKEAIKSLYSLRPLLKEEKQKKLDTYIEQLSRLQDLIAKDAYGDNNAAHLQQAERIRRNILKDFSLPKVKNNLA
jgi:hypothetical protein